MLCTLASEPQPCAGCRFPERGGTGAIWKGVAGLLPAAQQRFRSRVVSLDAAQQTVTLQNGSRIRYEALVSTVPLDTSLRWLGKREWADGLTHSSSHIVGVGVRGACPHGSKCWLYFPEDDCPFYRRAPLRSSAVPRVR